MADHPARRTPLTGHHEALSANMADFAGYHMPLWYPTGARKEHLAVITAAGLFDTSHMAVVGVSGSGAMPLLQECFTKDLAAGVGPENGPLRAGHCAYGAFLTAAGHVIDDAIVYRTGTEDFLVVVNAGMGDAIARHLSGQPSTGAAVITDFTGRIGKIDIQGPLAARILGRVIADAADVFSGQGYFAFKGHFDPGHPAADRVRTMTGHPVLLSRTGYTGEFGFEVFVAAEQTVPLWDALMAAGKADGLLPCGLAARDSLRAGAMLPLSHQDIGDWPYINHPWTFALPWDRTRQAFTKTFIGARALIATDGAPHTLGFAGNDLRKVNAREAKTTDTAGRPIGTVLTCATDMAIDRIDGRIVSVASEDRPPGFSPRGLCCGFVKVDTPLAPGTPIFLEDHRRRVAATIVEDVRPDRTARRPINRMYQPRGGIHEGNQ